MTVQKWLPLMGVGGGAMGVTREAFAAWLEKYGRAWEAREAKAAAELYTEEGTYQVTPFVEPMRGRAAILEYWKNVAQKFVLNTRFWQ